MSKLISEKIIHENIHFATIMRPHLADEGLTFLTDDENSAFKEEYGDSFQSMIGAEAIQKLLSEVNLKEEQIFYSLML